MADYINYSGSNVTGMTGALEHAEKIFYEGTGMDFFIPFTLILIFAGVLAYSSEYGFKIAFQYASAFTTIVCFMFVAGQFLEPIWLILCLVLTGIALAMGGD